jgi:hypothetical protein
MGTNTLVVEQQMPPQGVQGEQGGQTVPEDSTAAMVAAAAAAAAEPAAAVRPARFLVLLLHSRHHSLDH